MNKCQVWVTSVFVGMMLVVASSVRADEWRIHLGPSYVGGFMDVADHYEDRLEAMGYSVDSDWQVPVGLAFSATYEFSHGSRLSLDLGPAGVIYVTTIGGGSGDYDFVDVPLGATYGFTFVPGADVSPYARVGFRYHVASGDFVDSSSIGPLGAIGVEFMKNRAVGWGFEVAYDASSIEMDDGEDIDGGLLVSLFVSL